MLPDLEAELGADVDGLAVLPFDVRHGDQVAILFVAHARGDIEVARQAEAAAHVEQLPRQSERRFASTEERLALEMLTAIRLLDLTGLACSQGDTKNDAPLTQLPAKDLRIRLRTTDGATKSLLSADSGKFDWHYTDDQS